MTNMLGANLNNGEVVCPQGEGRQSPSKFPAYPAYKDSGVEWLAEVPQHWSVLPVKWVGWLKGGAGFPHDKQGVDSHELDFHKVNALASADSKGVLRSSENTITRETAKELGAYVFPEGTIVFAKVGAALLLGRLRTISTEACIDNNMMGLVVAQEKVTNRFALYSMGTVRFDLIANPGAVPSLNEGQIGNYRLAIPGLTEQTQIARFLDHETARIDELIEEQQRLIELLKEKRQAAVFQAVTKGIDPTVPMKDSGVEWMGEVPEHWNVKVLRYLGECQNGINIGGEAFGSGSPFVSYGDVYKNHVLPREVGGLVQSSPEDQQRYSVRQGDVLFTRTSETVDEIGFSSTCLQSIENATFAGFLIRFRPIGESLSPHFSKYYFRNQGLRTFFNKEMNLVTRASLSQDLLKLLPVTVPPLSEQNKIAGFLDRITETFASLLEQGLNSIELLTERRSALISAAVTGKIDVRGWQSPASAPSPELVQEAV